MLPDDEKIRRRAYEIWEREGRPEGQEAEHWRRAADELAAAGPERRDAQDVPAARMREPAKLDETPSPKAATPEAGPGAAPRPDPQSDPLALTQPLDKAASRKRNGPARGTKARTRPDSGPLGDKAPDRTR